jgi:hypothetical protein
MLKKPQGVGGPSDASKDFGDFDISLDATDQTCRLLQLR